MNCLQKGIECGQFRGQVPENEERMCTYSVHVHTVYTTVHTVYTVCT